MTSSLLAITIILVNVSIRPDESEAKDGIIATKSYKEAGSPHRKTCTSISELADFEKMSETLKADHSSMT